MLRKAGKACGMRVQSGCRPSTGTVHQTSKLQGGLLSMCLRLTASITKIMWSLCTELHWPLQTPSLLVCPTAYLHRCDLPFCESLPTSPEAYPQHL